jgi:hypothetical protein
MLRAVQPARPASFASYCRAVNRLLRCLTLLILLLPGVARAQASVWAGAVPGSSSSSGATATLAVATDAAGNVFVTGYFTGSVAFGSTRLSSIGGEDLFVAKYVPSTATWAWAQSGGGIDDERGNGIAVSGTSVYVTGYFINNTANANSVFFGSTGITAGSMQVNGTSSTLSQDLLLAKYTDSGTSATLGWIQVGGGTSRDGGNGVAANGTSVYVTGYIVNSTANANSVVFGGTGTTPGTVLQYGTGAGSGDLVVAKYTDNGSSATLGWTQVGGGNGGDQGMAVAVNGTSVYVTGSIQNTKADFYHTLFGGTGTTPGTVSQYGVTELGAYDLVVAKYTDNGSTATLGWTQVGGGGEADIGYGVAVSGSSVYVTGQFRNTKTNTYGVLFGGSGTTPGTVQVNGASNVSWGDLILIKYTDNGSSATLGWTQVGGGGQSDQGMGVAVSGTSVYVTGSITNDAANSGTVLFGGTGITPGTVPVNGATPRSGIDLVLAKYTDNGSSATLGWTQVGGGVESDQGMGVAVSGTSVYAGGSMQPTYSYPTITPFYNFGAASTAPLAGTINGRAFIAQAIDAGTTGSWQGLVSAFNGGAALDVAVATDAAGSVFVTGYFTGQIEFGSTRLTSLGLEDLFVAKYVPSTATWAWAQSGGGKGSDRGMSIAVSGASVYVSGAVYNTTSDTYGVLLGGTGTTPGTVQVNGATSIPSSDLLVVKYTDNGSSATLGWTQVGGGSGQDYGQGIAVSGSSVYVTGIIFNSTTSAGVVFGGTGTTPGTVQLIGTNTNSDLVVAKYTDNGSTATLGWTQVGGGVESDQGMSVAVSGTSVYVTGSITNSTANNNGVLFGGTATTRGTTPQYGASTTNSQDLIVAKYTDNGSSATLGWTQVGGGIGSDTGTGLAVSGTNVYVTGSITNNISNAKTVLFGGAGSATGTVQQNGASTTNSQDLIVAKYTDNGSSATLGWTQVGGGINNDIGSGIAASGTSVYVTGTITNSTANTNGVLFGGSGTTPGTVPVNGVSIINSTDLVVAKYTDNGSSATLGWSQVGGGTSSESGYGVAVSGQNVLVVGTAWPGANFGNFTVPTGAGISVLAHVVDSSLPLPVKQPSSWTSAAALQLYPNPAPGTATLTGAQPGTSVQVFDALGRLVLTATADASGTARLTLPADQPAGVYLVRASGRIARLVRD